ncbi:hypothetical protein PDN26_04660 [Bacillus cereus]|nr:hypothetical protein [Bacillus cereus]MDA2499391.1 hypothetical protein [Bacillus cereus]
MIQCYVTKNAAIKAIRSCIKRETILKRVDSKTEKTVLILCIGLALPTIGISLLFMVLYGLIKDHNRKTDLV